MGSPRRLEAGAGAVALCTAAVALLAMAAPAAADRVICEEGAGAGQCTAPAAIDVDRSAGLLYVADAGNGEVDVYDAEGGEQVGGWEAGFAVSSLAVDNDEASPAFGDLYVFDRTNGRIVRFNPAGEVLAEFGEGLFASQPQVDVGSGGTVYVADNPGGDCRLRKFDHEGNLLATVELGACSSLRGLSVDSAGTFYAAFGGGVGVRKYDSDGVLVAGFHPSFNIQALALDAEGNLFVSDAGNAGEATIYAYDPAAALFKVLYGDGTLAGRPSSLAPLGEAGEDLFALEGEGERRVVRVSYPPPGPAVYPDPALNRADPVSATKVTLTSRVNPEGEEATYRFEYVSEDAYLEDIEAGGEGFSTAQSTESAPVPAPESLPAFLEGLPLFALSPVSTQVGCADPPGPQCLEPETAYRFRAVAMNADGESVGPVASFETEPPLRVEEAFSSEVGTDSAKLSAEATAFGIPLSGHFEYVPEALCLADVEAAEAEGAEDPASHCFERASRTAEIDFGDQEGPVTRSARLVSLDQDTPYRYRVVLENVLVPEGRSAEALAFATYALPAPEACPNDALRTGPAAKLPDCRAYELVSPLDKGGADIEVQPTQPQGLPAEANQAAATVPASGAGLTYSADRSFGDAVSAPYTSQYLASRSPGDGDGVLEAGEGWTSHGISPRREGGSFLGLAGLESQYRFFSADLRFGWLRTDSEPPLTAEAIPAYANLYRRDNASEAFEALCPAVPLAVGEPPEAVGPANYRPLPLGASADGRRTVFRANAKLSEDAADNDNTQLYGCEAGATEPVVVSVLPGGEASAEGSTVGSFAGGLQHRGLSLHNAVSADAERVWWSAGGRIYLRQRPFAAGEECVGSGPCTVAVSAAVDEEGSDAGAHFWTAARDGSRAIFSFTSGPLAGGLYEFDADAEAAPTRLIAADTAGVAGWSEDARRVYFTSSEKLTPEAAAGQLNVYLHEAGEEPRLVAGAIDAAGGTGFCTISDPVPVRLGSRRCARASADGRRLAFLSRAPLSGYDNLDAASGEPTVQVFLYDAAGRGGAGELLCVSCNPSGGRPTGREGTAAKLPGVQDAFHAARALSADGRRLFFESYDALLPADANGALDVYQWERAGKGGCDAADANHFPANGGCIELISSGEDRNDSELLDASADGNDVFFKTAESLWGPDPGLVDIYDARAGGGFPAPAPPRPPCEGEACQSPPAPPRQPTGASALFAGPGDLAAPRSRCARGARKARRLSRRAKRLRRAARRAGAPPRARKLRRRARGAAKRARRHSLRAKRCRRARAGAARRARR